jgi:hypothetical protein
VQAAQAGGPLITRLCGGPSESYHGGGLWGRRPLELDGARGGVPAGGGEQRAQLALFSEEPIAVGRCEASSAEVWLHLLTAVRSVRGRRLVPFACLGRSAADTRRGLGAHCARTPQMLGDGAMRHELERLLARPPAALLR